MAASRAACRRIFPPTRSGWSQSSPSSASGVWNIGCHDGALVAVADLLVLLRPVFVELPVPAHYPDDLPAGVLGLLGFSPWLDWSFFLFLPGGLLAHAPAVGASLYGWYDLAACLLEVRGTRSRQLMCPSDEAMYGRGYLLLELLSVKVIHTESRAPVAITHGVSGQPVEGSSGLFGVLVGRVIHQPLEPDSPPRCWSLPRC